VGVRPKLKLELEHAIRVRIVRRDGLSDVPQLRDTISIEPEDMNNRRARNAGAMTDMRVEEASFDVRNPFVDRLTEHVEWDAAGPQNGVVEFLHREF
jgi:hypothetical protein